jgi:hypothetical protein
MAHMRNMVKQLKDCGDDRLKTNVLLEMDAQNFQSRTV